MCLIAFAWRVHPRYPLLLVGNRDEFHHRPAAPLARWRDDPAVVGGRDLEAGGTWLALHASGRLGAVTNFRDPASLRPGAPSRGGLVPRFLAAADDALAAARAAAAEGDRYSGFNLLLYDGRTLAYAANRPEPCATELPPGVYGLSNHRLDTPWPKLVAARQAFAAALASPEPADAALFAAVTGRQPAPDPELPDTGVGLELERLLSAQFIVSPRYGTRATTLVALGRDGRARLVERSYDADGAVTGRAELQLSLPVAPGGGG